MYVRDGTLPAHNATQDATVGNVWRRHMAPSLSDISIPSGTEVLEVAVTQAPG